MYNEYFGFKETPFSIAPDPRYLYMSDQHREAFAHLLFGINSDGGFVLLTGEVGTGKTTVCRCLLEQLPQDCDVAFIINPRLSVEELLSTICDEFQIPYPANNTSNKTFVDLINKYLLAAHSKSRKTVLIIDEAQNLSADVLEQMRLLTNLETNQRKLLQIIMLGQPELQAMLLRPELRQLAQRIIARYHLLPLTKYEVEAYVQHRLAVAGSQRQLFTASSLVRLYRLSGGVPRLVNVLCDRALLGAYAQGKDGVDKATLVTAAREVFGESGWCVHRYRGLARSVMIGLVMLCGGALLATAYHNQKAVPILSRVVTKPQLQKTETVAEYRKPIPAASEKTVSQQQGSAATAHQDVAAVKGEPAPLGKLQWPPDQSIEESEGTASRVLFEQWGLSYQPHSGMTACHQAETQGLACLSDHGSLDDLKQMNRPVILKLFDDQGRTFYATLIALDGDAATFALGGEEKRVAISDIPLRWRGEYTLLWRSPPDYQWPVQVGAEGPMVDWLGARLAQLEGKADPPRKAVTFDQTLADEVKKFQLTQGLKPDGIVGPQTLIRLNGALHEGGPRLFTNKEGSR